MSGAFSAENTGNNVFLMANMLTKEGKRRKTGKIGKTKKKQDKE